MVVVRSGDDYDWTNAERPLCSSDAGIPNEAGVLNDSGVVNDAGDAGTESQSNISNAAKVLSEMRPGLRDCYQRLLDRDVEAEGSVRLKLRVNCEGYVSRIRGTVSGRLDEDIIRCVFALAKEAHFEPPLGGAAAVTFPVNFKRAARTPTP